MADAVDIDWDEPGAGAGSGSDSDSDMETLHCVKGDHDWQRERQGGRKPKSCPEHAPSTDKTPKGRNGGPAPKLERVLYDQFMSMSMGLAMAGLMRPALGRDAIIIREHAAQLAKAWATWAETNPRVKRWLMAGSSAGGLLGVFLATAPVAQAIWSNHANGTVPQNVVPFPRPAPEPKTEASPRPGTGDVPTPGYASGFSDL